MKEYMVKLESIDDVKEFVGKTNRYPYDCDLVSGRYAVDAKSIMGIFSLDLSKPLKFVIHGEDGTDEDLVDEVSGFIVKD